MAYTEIAYRFTPSVDDTSPEEELEDELEETKAKIKTRLIAPLSDEQCVHFYGTLESPEGTKEPTTSTGDHPYLNIFDLGHRYLFWA
ncbi:hypothetical protein K456DRAFT_1730571 [Colletotrichum gloeosporioides 23]|nr:hypothetical protein K456DRAFT_1730571 [Colletotrichum gloeosporioides 23]